jgi:hypothetical protein
MPWTIRNLRGTKARSLNPNEIDPSGWNDNHATRLLMAPACAVMNFRISATNPHCE